jgi:hypothetical protein
MRTALRRNTARRQPAPSPPDVDVHGADAWIGYFRRLTETSSPGWRPPAEGLRASRTNALRAGQYRERPLNTG